MDSEQIKNEIDIVNVILQYIPLTRSGTIYVGKCPFHKGEDKVFTVSPNKQIYHCFGCGVGGNVISFLKKYKEVSLEEVQEELENLIQEYRVNNIGRAIRNGKDEVIITTNVEDVKTAEEIGIDNIVSVEELNLKKVTYISNIFKDIIVCDNISINFEIENVCNIKVLDLERQSISDFIKTKGAEQLKEKISNASYYIDYKIDKAKQNLNLSDLKDKEIFINKIIEILLDIDNLIAREVYIEKITNEYDIDKGLIINKIKGVDENE